MFYTYSVTPGIMMIFLEKVVTISFFFFRFVQDESDSNVDLEPQNTLDNETSSREQNNNSMFQQNLELHTENTLVNSR